MKILKQGKSKEEVDRIIKRVRQFECLTCGCVFEADNTEYKYQFCQREGDEWWECECPNCGARTSKSIPARARNADNNNYSNS